MHQNENFKQVYKLAVSIKMKNKVRDTVPIFELGNKLGLNEEEILYCIKYAGL